MPDEIQLLLLDQPRRLDFEELEPATSPLTLRPLRRIAVTMHVGDTVHDQLGAQLQESRYGRPIGEVDGGMWELEDHCSQKSGDGPWTYNVVLRQREAINISQLDFAGLSLTPDKTKVAEELGIITICASVTVTAEQHQVIEDIVTSQYEAHLSGDAANAYMSVLAVGLRDEPIRMRFGACPWEKTDDGARYVLVLVSEEGDTKSLQRGKQPSDPKTEALIRNSLMHSAKVDALISELERAGVLSSEAVARIADAASARPPRGARREYWRTKHLDDFVAGYLGEAE